MDIWAIFGIVVTIVIAISVFAGNQIAKKQRDRRIERERKLRIHFEDINRGVINYISEMARSLGIRKERLVTSRAPISESYDFEEQELYKCFELHFPEEAKEWKKLNKQAVKLSEDVVSFFQKYQYSRAASKQNMANESIKDLQQKFQNFDQKLTNKMESIDKYELGKTFRKHKKCPICKKF